MSFLRIYGVDVRTSEVEFFTEEKRLGLNRLAVYWSPDSQYGAIAEGKLQLITPDGQLHQPIGDDSAFGGVLWSPSSDYLLTYCCETNDLRLVSMHNGTQRIVSRQPDVGTPHQFTWMPDNVHILFALDDEHSTEGIYMTNVLTDETHRLIDTSETPLPAWLNVSPDGQWLSYTAVLEPYESYNQFHVLVNLNTLEKYSLIKGSHHQSNWSLDSQWLFIQDSDEEGCSYMIHIPTQKVHKPCHGQGSDSPMAVRP